jgi:hypothetical protein
MRPVDKTKRIMRLAWYCQQLNRAQRVNDEQLEAAESELLDLFGYRHPSYEATCVAGIVYAGDEINSAIKKIFAFKTGQ